MSNNDGDITTAFLPKNLLYPITVLKIHVKEEQTVQKHTTILTYKYYDYEPIPISEIDDEHPDESERQVKKVENVGTYESGFDGTIRKIYTKVGDEITDNSKPIFDIIESCSHPIQYGGLCAVCGKSIEEEEMNKRTPISMAHGSTDLKVSSKEAEKIERSSTDRLLNEKKLSLVVDLDQTVIHVTVDPTVDEWMSDPNNPNYNAVKDVKSFILEEPPFIPFGYNGPPIPPTKRWYYVKLRPGLAEFLSKMNERYEMHIYTMATRQYAEEIAKIIDPDRIYFGDRILSRDESGSLTQKSLKRLFPVDTSMVVVIDDRGDVWNWSPNLIKVVPYDFFLGIGDINSSFLPRQQSLLGPSKRRKSVNKLEETIINSEEKKTLHEQSLKSNSEEAIAEEDEDEDEDEDEKADVEDNKHSSITEENNLIEPTINETSSSPVERLIELNNGEDNNTLLAVQETERTNTLEQQEHDRPLAKLQQNLEKIIEQEEVDIVTEKKLSNNGKKSDSEGKLEKETHNLLYDDDRELEYLGQALVRIHNEYYFEIEQNEKEHKKSNPDVKDIMIEMKSIVFQNCVFLLSSVLPLGTKIQNADIVIWAKSFGARFVENYTPEVTHVICKNPGTFKVRLAKSVDANVKVVNPDWVFACMSLWDRISEGPYTLEVEHLLSKSQVQEFMNSIKPSNSGVIDWGEIDDEMKEFMGSDYEDDEDDDDEEDNIEGGNANGSLKHDREDTDNEEEANKKQKTVTKEDDADSESDSFDEFERDLLDHLADLE